MIALQRFLLEHDCKNMTNEQMIDLFNTKNIELSFEPDLILFKYGIEADFADAVVKNCRGIILYRDDFSIACYPFDKFGNYNESYADDIDWTTARVQEKLDGSLIKVWFNKLTNKWVVSTNGCIYAEKAPQPNTENYLNLFNQSKSKVDFEKLNQDLTYMFELVSPDNKLVLDYAYTDLWHIGTRNNITCEEVNIDIGIQKPVEYDVSTLEDTITFVNKICTPQERHEGCVVVDKNWRRVKVKNAFYIQMHYMKTKVEGNIKTVLEFMDSGDVDEFIAYAPEIAHIFNYYKWQFEEFKWELGIFLNTCERLRTLYSDSKKNYALEIKENKFSAIGFKFYDYNYSIDDVLNNLHYIDMLKYAIPYRRIFK